MSIGFKQSPNNFDIFEIAESVEVSLKRFDNVFWKQNEKKLFAFHNTKSRITLIMSIKMIHKHILTKHYLVTQVF